MSKKSFVEKITKIFCKEGLVLLQPLTIEKIKDGLRLSFSERGVGCIIERSTIISYDDLKASFPKTLKGGLKKIRWAVLILKGFGSEDPFTPLGVAFSIVPDIISIKGKKDGLRWNIKKWEFPSLLEVN